MISFKIFVFFTATLSFSAHGEPRSELARLNYFDIDLLRYCAEERHGNVLVSPASIKCTLAMLLEGAQGATEAELRSALRLPPNREEFRDQLNTYLQSLSPNSTGAVLKNANSIFASTKLNLLKEFEKQLQFTYLTEVYRMNFTNPDADAAFINKWVSTKTNGLIPDIIEPGTNKKSLLCRLYHVICQVSSFMTRVPGTGSFTRMPLVWGSIFALQRTTREVALHNFYAIYVVNVGPTTEILLTNAVFFKASWQHAFDPTMTRGGCFYYQGACKNVAMMDLRAQLNYAYVEELRAHALELPYEGGRYSMIVLVPIDRDGCPLLIRDLPYMSLAQVSQLLEPSDVQLTMPKFSIDYAEDMVGPLKNMRIQTLFSATSNLSGIFEGHSPQLNSLYHKVHMTVDEQGTVAAAASSAMVIPLIENGVTLRVDKPFVFFIKDNKLGVVLFEGRIEEPTPFVIETDLTAPQKEAPKPQTLKKQPFRH